MPPSGGVRAQCLANTRKEINQLRFGPEWKSLVIVPPHVAEAQAGVEMGVPPVVGDGAQSVSVEGARPAAEEVAEVPANPAAGGPVAPVAKANARRPFGVAAELSAEELAEEPPATPPRRAPEPPPEMVAQGEAAMALLDQPAIGIQLNMAGDGSETTSVYQHRVEDLCERLQEAGVSERSIGQGALVEQWKRTCLTRWRIDDAREGINTNVHILAVCRMSEFAYFHEDPIDQALACLYALAYFAGTNAED